MLPVTTQSTPLGYQPGLDGLRGLFVLAVLAFHGGFSWAEGGYLGVSGFFTLSGFLICSLLIDERLDHGRIDLVRFWSRRARRLLPAAWLGLAGALLYGITVASPAVQRDLPGDVLAAFLYVANWRFIFTDASYEALFSEPSPVNHLWSLAIEEQYYLVFPLLVAGVLTLARGRRVVLGGLLVAMSLASLGWMAYLHDPGADTSRVYYGTDTRAAEMLIGAAAAIVWQRWFSRPFTGGSARAREWGLQLLGAGALLAVIVAWVQVPVTSSGLYRGGFALHALAIVAVLFAVVRPGPMRSLSAFEPLRRLGLISYGVYLYHWPIFLWLNAGRTGLDGWSLFGVRLAATLGVSLASYFLVERPIRSGARLRGRVGIAAIPVSAAVLVAAIVAFPTPQQTSMQVAVGTDLDHTAFLDIETIERELRAIEASSGSEVAEETRPPRVMVVGDSTALALVIGLSAVQTEDDSLRLVPGRTVLGCGLVRASALRTQGAVYPLSDGCAAWEDDWVELIDTHQPDVVLVYYGPWDASDKRLSGRDDWIGLGHPEYDEFARSEIRVALEVLTERVDQVVWLTSPPIDQSMNQLGHDADPASDPARLVRWNELAAEEVANYEPHEATMVDLRGWFEALPDGPFDPRVRPDGVHIADEEAPRVGRFLAEELLAIWSDHPANRS